MSIFPLGSMSDHRHQPEYDWLISRSQVSKAMRLQAAGAGIIPKIDTRVPAMRRPGEVDDVTPALNAALNEATGGRYSTLGATVLHMQALECHQSHRRDLLDPDAECESITTITGLMVVEHAEARSEPIAFTVDDSGTARLDEAALGVVSRWIDAVTGQAPKEAAPANEQPADEQPAAEQPADEQPAAEQPADEQPAAEQPAAEQPADAA